MAERHGFDVFFDSDYDPVIDRFDQKMKTNLLIIRFAYRAQIFMLCVR